MLRERVSLVGAGLAGALLAILLARRGFAVSLYERRPDPRQRAPQPGRSINLALAARGMRALEQTGLMDRVRPLTIEMRGRMVHESGRPPALQPYGQRPEEVIYSVGRAALNRLLIEEAARERGVSLHFGHTCVGVVGGGPESARGGLEWLGPDGTRIETAPTATVATDGAGSAVRAALAARGLASVREEPLDHDYKELTVPATPTGFALEPHALHVWPRHGFMLIALPNSDRSFTATLFLPRLGAPSFAALTSPGQIERFFAEHFADVAGLLPDLAVEFARHPQGRLGTVHCAPWHAGRYLLLGDAAHAIVPFHGQGMNAAFEDCLLLDGLIEQHADWSALCADFERRRRADAEAIAQMAIENYGEMRERVLDARFVRQQLWARELERRHPGRFIPRYAMVMFHPEIGYAEALRRGQVQQQILDELDTAAGGTGALDTVLADELIAARL
jgi:kynurenine 3-monooxygenase